MRSLYETITKSCKNGGDGLIKHLNACGINEWSDLTKANIADFRDHLNDTLAASSAHTYAAILKGFLARYEEDVEIPCKNYRDVLKVKNDKPLKTYLTGEELERLATVPAKSEVERFVRDEFLIGAYTGMRVSDALEVTSENVVDGYLTYVSKKTGVHATIPCKDTMLERIERVRKNDVEVTLVAYNEAIRRLCKRAGINKKVKVRKGSVDKVGEKWEFVSSHTARISFCTNLAKLGLPLLTISRMAGHTSTGMTERYIVADSIEIPQIAMNYFK